MKSVIGTMNMPQAASLAYPPFSVWLLLRRSVNRFIKALARSNETPGLRRATPT